MPFLKKQVIKLGRKFKKLKIVFYRHFWWFVLAACLLALLFYGLSTFTAKPTVETITTHAHASTTNNNQMHDVDFQSPKRMRKR